MLTHDEIHKDIEQGFKPEGIQTKVKTEVEEVEHSPARNMSIGRKTGINLCRKVRDGRQTLELLAMMLFITTTIKRHSFPFLKLFSLGAGFFFWDSKFCI